MGVLFESYVCDIFFFIISLLFLIWYDASRRLKYFEDRGMPHIKTSLTELIKSLALKIDINVGFDVMYNKFPNDSYVGYFQVLRPAFLIRDPQLIQNILIKDYQYFNDHGLPTDYKTDPLLASLFNLTGEEWKYLRHKLTPTFTSSKLKWMFPLMNDCANRLMNDNQFKESTDVEIKEFFATFTLDVIASCAFGLEGENIKDPNCDFRKHIQRTLTPKPHSLVFLFLRSLMPQFFRFFGIRSTPKEVEDFILSIAKQTFEYRKKTGVKRKDFIQLLLELREKGSVDYDVHDLEQDEKEYFKSHGETDIGLYKETLELTDELLAAQIHVFSVAGYENASFTLAFAAYFLAKNKALQEKVRFEISTKKHHYGALTYDAIKEMTLLDACISEALRLQPPVSYLMRKCLKDYRMEDGKIIEKGMSLIIPNMAVQRDTKFWDKSKEFYPERFLDSTNQIVKGTYLPFGDGPRVCIAVKFARMQSALMLAKLIEKFELLPSPKTKEPLKFTTFFTTSVVGGLYVKLKPI